MIAAARRSHLHLLEVLDRKALPAELTALQADARARIGAGSFPPAEVA